MKLPTGGHSIESTTAAGVGASEGAFEGAFDGASVGEDVISFVGGVVG